MNAWGKHAIFNLYKCNPYFIRNSARITDFSKTIVKAIDMVAYGEPQVIHFGTGSRAGYTLVQLIETSNIIAHFAESENKAFIDIFSCKDFDVKVAEDIIDKFFQPGNISTTVLERDAYPKYTPSTQSVVNHYNIQNINHMV